MMEIWPCGLVGDTKNFKNFTQLRQLGIALKEGLFQNQFREDAVSSPYFCVAGVFRVSSEDFGSSIEQRVGLGREGLFGFKHLPGQPKITKFQ